MNPRILYLGGKDSKTEGNFKINPIIKPTMLIIIFIVLNSFNPIR